MNAGLPKITVVMPSYNQGQFIEESIKSVINQKYPNLEFFIIDGGSKDNTVDIIKKYKKHIDYWISEKDKGQSNAINKGFKKASGEIITWLCSDDTYLNNSLSKVGSYFLNHPEVDFVFGNVNAIDEKGHTIKEIKNYRFNKLSFLARVNTISQPGSFYRKKILDEIGLIDENLHYCMDYDFFARMIAHGIKFKKINSTIATYRYHKQSKTVMSANQNDMHNQTMLKLQKKYSHLLGYNLKFIKLVKIYYKTIKILYNIPNYWKYRKSYVSNR